MQGKELAMGHPALTDSLTGLANRLHFEVVFDYLFQAADRGVPMALMLVSVGNVSDDERLKAVAGLFRSGTRSSDLPAHLGKGRFAVLLLGTNVMGARVAGDRFLEVLEEQSPGQVSIGLAGYRPDQKESADLFDAAAEALRIAQGAGGGLEMAPA